ncbi:MAG: TIGR03915 family putative DNA repair protein [Lachnospiraceae bacterium]|nr:TIGR03915 family putative DNA repair protein [Lachnospiraceae bacterium]
MYIFQCEDSIDGIFTGIYDAFASHYGHKNIRLSTNSHEDMCLFSEYISVRTDIDKSQKVGRTLFKRFGIDFYETICKCALADGSFKKLSMDKANAIYQTIVMAFALPEAEKVLNFLGEPCIACLFELCRQTNNEGHHYLGFLRFFELENGLLFAKIAPKNNVLPILAEHFTNRLPLENFMIYDETHKLAIIHKAGKDYLTVDASELDLTLTRQYSANEENYQKLFKTFFHSIAIEARKNPKLQSQNIPKRFWANTVELADCQ